MLRHLRPTTAFLCTHGRLGRSNRPLAPAHALPPQHVTPDGERFISSSGGAAEQRLSKVRQALQDGTLGFGFSAGGFLYPYHLGTLWELHELNILKDYKVGVFFLWGGGGLLRARAV